MTKLFDDDRAALRRAARRLHAPAAARLSPRRQRRGRGGRAHRQRVQPERGGKRPRRRADGDKPKKKTMGGRHPRGAERRARSRHQDQAGGRSSKGPRVRPRARARAPEEDHARRGRHGGSKGHDGHELRTANCEQSNVNRGRLSSIVGLDHVAFVCVLPSRSPLQSTTAPTFEPIQPDLFALGGSFVNAWADIDADGDADLFVGFNGTPNRLYRNDAGVFTDVAAERGCRRRAPGARGGVGRLRCRRRSGSARRLRSRRRPRSSGCIATSADGSRRSSPPTAGLTVETGAVRQLVVDRPRCRRRSRPVRRVPRSRRTRSFATTAARSRTSRRRSASPIARKSVGAVWFDTDDDGDLDLVVANMDGDANALFRNDRGQVHRRRRRPPGSRGAAARRGTRRTAPSGRVRPTSNGDGRLDLFFANYGPNGLFLNRGRPIRGRVEGVGRRDRRPLRHVRVRRHRSRWPASICTSTAPSPAGTQLSRLSLPQRRRRASKT